MKEYIHYFYQIPVEDIRLIEGKYFFHDRKYRYMLESVPFPYDRLEELYQFQLELNSNSEFYHQILKNVNGNIVTPIERKNYILLKLSNVSFDSISIFDLKATWNLSLSHHKDYSNIHFPWSILWEKKIDYFEGFFIKEKEISYRDSILLKYFIGLGENAILYLKESLKSNSSSRELVLVPSHYRVSNRMSLVEFYNPLNIILDLRVRDIAEYFKDSFWDSRYDLREMESFLDQAYFSKVEAELFFSRLLFPSFYFDCLERDEVPSDMENRIEEYQFFITDIYYYLKDRYRIEEIKWLKKKT